MNISSYLGTFRIGHTGDEPWETMHRADQRIVRFRVAFQECSAPPETRDFRLCLERLWSPLLPGAGLAAMISHEGVHPEHGPGRIAIGSVWRQHGRERIGTVTEREYFRLSELLRGPESQVAGFGLTEQITTKQRGKFEYLRQLRLRKGEFTIEVPQQQTSEGSDASARPD